MKYPLKRLAYIKILLVIIGGLVYTSCATRKQIAYLQDVTPSVDLHSQYQIPMPRIAKGDMLGITVNSKMRALSDPFNLPMVGYYTMSGTSQSSMQQGYVVDSSGQIDFPVLGAISVEGKTRRELSDYLSRRLREEGYVNDATVSVSLLNFKISVLGEVAHPGTFSIQTDEVSLLDALAMAGDLTIQARRDNVLVLREIDGQRMIVSHDLRSQEIFKSPCYFLRQGDIVIVEPNKARIQTAAINSNNNVGTWLSIIGTVTSLTTFVMTMIANQQHSR